MKITYFGHACLSIQISDINLLVDPFISGNPKASAVDIDSIKADYILITHAHLDHLLDVETIATNNNSVIISNYEIANRYASKGYTIHPMNHGGSWSFDFGKVKYISALHSSAFADGTYGGNPGSFVIQTPKKNIYISGDTALSFDMKLIPMFTKIDLAVLTIGGNFTMDVDEALVASDFIECNKILGYHFDTDHYITIDHGLAKQKFTEKGKELILLEIGEVIEI